MSLIKLKITLALLFSLVLVSGCTASSLLGFQADIPIRSFGNIVDDKQFSQLKVGMTREQVAYIIGSPAMATPYEPNTWTYNLMVYNGDERIRLSSFKVHFDEDVKVEKWEFEQGGFLDLNITGEFKALPTGNDESDANESEIDSEDERSIKNDDAEEHIKIPDA